MKAAETGSSTSRIAGRQSHVAKFAKVLDARKQPIRALWVRNGRYYGQLKVENPINGIEKTRRIPLSDKEGNAVTTVALGRRFRCPTITSNTTRPSTELRA